MKEDIVSFPIENIPLPFILEMTGISYCDGSYKIRRSNSSIACMEYIIKGEGVVETQGKTFYPGAGDIYILHQGDDHYYYSDSKNPWTKIWFNIRGNLTTELLQTYGLAHVNHVRGLAILPLFERFLENARSQSLSTYDIYKANALVFHEIIQEIALFLTKAEMLPKEAILLKDYLDKNIEQNISIAQLSTLIYKSKSQTTRIFKSAFGVSPYEYAMLKKIETAKLLLKNTRLQIKEISFRLGFSDEHYFSNYFKSKTGMPPKQYRYEK